LASAGLGENGCAGLAGSTAGLKALAQLESATNGPANAALGSILSEVGGGGSTLGNSESWRGLSIEQVSPSLFGLIAIQRSFSALFY
jgi:hypothetical protein